MEAREIKKVTKNFSDTSQEEKWLQRMLTDGWVLQSYDAEDVGDCRYIFKAITNDSQKDLLYKVDFRSFDKNEEFEEYKGIFEDAGWTLLSKNKLYTKHIFYTDSSNPHKEIFSDSDLNKQLEKRKGWMNLQKKYLILTMLGLALMIISTVISYQCLSGIILGVALSLLASSSYKMLRNEKENH